MNPFEDFGKSLIILGLFIAFIGLLMSLGGKIPYLGRLPGDIIIKKGNFTFYFPVVTCIVVSALLTLIFSLLFRR
jgi:hypothetical protein